jgi:hypothetical protein
MKNCSNPTPCEQKKLLKVLTCLYKKYILNQTPATNAYFANPIEGDATSGYEAMRIELNSINNIINLYLETNKVFVDSSGNNIAQVDLYTAVAQGMVHFNTALDSSSNTFANAIDNSINVNGVISNVGVLKTVQKLNLDDCAEKAYQVTPVTNDEGEGQYSNKTQASLVERICCPGVSNLGFLGMTLQVPLDSAPFNSCSINKC